MREKQIKRIKRHKRIRKRMLGTKTRPRLCIYRGLANIQAQLIDDIKEETLVSVSTQHKDFKKQISYGGNLKAAVLLGKVLAEQAKTKGIAEVVFDRGGFLYHGRVRALADSAREHGLRF